MAVAALVAAAVLDVLHTVIATGHYEYRITTVSHGEPDLGIAWWLYAFLDHVLPRGMTTVLAARLWTLGLLVAGAAFVTWLVRARRDAGRLGAPATLAPAWALAGWFIPVANLVIPYRVARDVQRASGADPASQAMASAAPVGRWWAGVIATLLLNGLIALHAALTSPGGILRGEALDTRLVAYPLWTFQTAAMVATTVFGAQVVLRITEALEQAGRVRSTA